MSILDTIKKSLGFAQQPADAAGPKELYDRLSTRYSESAKEFYDYLPAELRSTFVDDAIYHRQRYLDMLGLPMGERVLELGSDKPFISHFIRTLHPHAEVHTVSIDIPFSPYPITRIDIEAEVFPFEPGSMSDVLFTEVLEHLFRDPAWTFFQINRVLKKGGKLFLTTPNACGYDVLVNLLHQVAPNGRNQFYEAIESGHPHLWTAQECSDILKAHGFSVAELSTVDYYEMPLPAAVKDFLAANSVSPTMNGQCLRIVAEKQDDATGPAYIKSLFPQGKPVKLQGALLEWAKKALAA
jgi:SAM-dependent methyltransferase